MPVAGFADKEYAISCWLKYAFLRPLVWMGVRPTFPDDPWYEPEQMCGPGKPSYAVMGVGSIYGGGGHQVAFDWAEKAIIEHCGEVTFSFPAERACIVQAVHIESVRGEVTSMEVLPNMEPVVRIALKNLTDRWGRKLEVKVTDIDEATDIDSEYDSQDEMV